MNRKFSTVIFILLCMAFTGSAFAFDLDEFGKVDIHGFVSQGYLITTDNNFYADTSGGGTSQFNEVGINFTSDVSDRLRVGVQLYSRDLGRLGNNDVTLDWAYADYSVKSWFSFRAGRVKLPFGLHNMERDIDMLRTFIFLPQSFYNEGWRDSANSLNGGGFYGYIPAGVVGNFSYDAYFGNTNIEPDSGVSRLLVTAMPVYLGLEINQVDVKRTNAGTATWDTILGIDGLKVSTGAWEVNFNAQVEHNNGAIDPWIDPTTNNPTGGYDLVRVSNIFQANALTTSASVEYARGNMVMAAEVMQNDLDFYLTGTPKISYKTLGYYGAFTYRFTDWFELGLCYGEYFANQDDKYGDKRIAAGDTTIIRSKQYQKDLTLGLRFDLSANWVFKLEGHSIDGTALLLADENLKDADGNSVYEPKWYLGAAKLTFSF